MKLREEQRARRHHIVSKFYLERFADARGMVRQTWLPGSKTHLSNINNVSVVRDYFSIEFEKDGQVIVSDFWEKVFAEVEGAAADAFRSIESGEWPIAAGTRESLAAWVALQWLRGDSKRAQQAEIQASHYRLIVGANGIGRLRHEMETGLRRSVGDDELEAEWMDLTQDGGPRVVADAADHLETVRRRFPQVTERLVASGVAAWHFDRKTLLTSDTPVVLIGEPPYPGGGLGLETADYVALPLSRHIALAFVRGGGQDSRSAGTTAIAKAFNGAVSFEARRWCIAHPEDDLVKMGAVLTPPRPRELQANMDQFIHRDRLLETTLSREDVDPRGYPHSIPLVYPAWPLPGRVFDNPYSPRGGSSDYRQRSGRPHP